MPGIFSPHFEPSRFNTSGSSSITGSLTVVGNLNVSGAINLTGTLDMNNYNIINLASPTASLDAVNKGYIDVLELSNMHQTTASMQVYANGTSGNDANDGMTVSTPKKTLQAVLDLVPFSIRHNVCVNLSGTFTDPGNLTINHFVSGIFIIDGGESVTVVADNVGSSWVSDINSVSSIGLSTLTWTPDQYERYWVEITSGPALGQTRTIFANTATTIIPQRDWSVNPGVGATFRIVRPNTEIATTVTNPAFKFGFLGPGSVNIQNLYFNGSNSGISTSANVGFVTIAKSILNVNSALAINCNGGLPMSINNLKRDTSSFVLVTANTTASCGVSLLGASSGISYLQCKGTTTSIASLIVGNQVLLSDVMLSNFINGCKAKSMSIRNSELVSTSDTDTIPIRNGTGYAVTTISGSSGVGISIKNGYLGIGSGVNISNCTSHAIRCEHSHLKLDGTLTGSGVSGFAVYAFNNSTVNSKAGTPPTLSGSKGYISTDGTTQLTDWTTLNLGTGSFNTNTATLITAI